MDLSGVDISRAVIGKLRPPPLKTLDPVYEDAVQKGAVYWDLVLEGKDATEAKQAADEALSRLLGCDAKIDARIQKRRAILKEWFFGFLHDTYSRIRERYNTTLAAARSRRL